VAQRVARQVGTNGGPTVVAPGKVGWPGSHRRRPAVVGQRKWPGAAAFQCDSKAPVAREGVDESCSWRRG
jgi:hypothetical protein